MHYAKNLKRILKSHDPKDRALVQRVNEEILRTKGLAGTVHNNATLTNLSVQYQNEDFIGEQLMPVVGVTLPLFSYGGSSVSNVVLALALLMSVSLRRNAVRPERF